jgi:hypothetical protein
MWTVSFAGISKSQHSPLKFIKAFFYKPDYGALIFLVSTRPVYRNSCFSVAESKISGGNDSDVDLPESRQRRAKDSARYVTNATYLTHFI